MELQEIDQKRTDEGIVEMSAASEGVEIARKKMELTTG